MLLPNLVLAAVLNPHVSVHPFWRGPTSLVPSCFFGKQLRGVRSLRLLVLAFFLKYFFLIFFSFSVAGRSSGELTPPVFPCETQAACAHAGLVLIQPLGTESGLPANSTTLFPSSPSSLACYIACKRSFSSSLLWRPAFCFVLQHRCSPGSLRLGPQRRCCCCCCFDLSSAFSVNYFFCESLFLFFLFMSLSLCLHLPLLLHCLCFFVASVFFEQMSSGYMRRYILSLDLTDGPHLSAPHPASIFCFCFCCWLYTRFKHFFFFVL
mmetsp:Transcript_85235/g.178117  ORF Transcript_85235/g.178117 Transcript_85235/m.178117 type:complete len:265 (+) Transcript_85235:589-1383(+)